MRQQPEALGIAQVDIRYVRLQSLRGGWAYIRVPVATRGRGNSLEIVDNRPQVIRAAEEVFRVSGEINAVKRRRSTASLKELYGKLKEALAEFQQAFRTPAIVSYQEQVVVGGKQSYQRLILNDAGDDEPTAVLTVVRTRGTWHRDFRSPFAPVYRDRESNQALHPVFANHEGGTIWSFDENQVRAFHVSFPDGFIMTTYRKVVEEAEEEEEPGVEVETAAAGVETPSEPETEEQPRPAPAGKWAPKAAPAPAEPEGEGSELKEALAGPVKNGELAKLAGLKIGTVQEFLAYAEEDPDGLRGETGITKSRLPKAVDAARTWLTKHGGV